MTKRRNYSKLDVEHVYNRLAVFFFSTVLLIATVISLSLIPKHNYYRYIAFATFSLFFWGYGFLLGDFIGRYLWKTFDFFKAKYTRYSHIYWICFGIILLLALCFIGFWLLGWGQTVSIAISTGMYGALALCAYGLKRWHERRKRKTRAPVVKLRR